jgi:uncharacterized membrane protein
MRRDFNNDRIEVLKLQGFLINFEGHTNVSLTGVFDQATFDAVSAFQLKYFNDILEPWGHTDSTGYVYILTLKKINEIYCQRIYPLNQAQINEIVAFRALLESLKQQGIDVSLPSIPVDEVDNEGQGDISTTTPPLIPIVGQVVGQPEPDKGQNLNIASIIFAQPSTISDTLECLYQLILVIIVLYIIGNVLKDVLYKDTVENTRKRFLTKWIAIDVGILMAVLLAFLLDLWCLILPLLIIWVLSLMWTSTYSKHNSIRASVKSWYLVSHARVKTFWKSEKKIISEPKEYTKKESKDEVIVMGPKHESKK